MIFNRLSIALLAISLTFTMCKNSDSCSIVRGGDALAFENKTFADTLFKSDSHSPEECKAIVEIDIEYPTENSLLGRSIREWIDDELFICSQSVLDSIHTQPAVYEREDLDGQKVVDFYGKEILHNLPYLEESGIQSEYILRISTIYETDKFVTYQVEKNIYFSGSAHGVNPIYGVTFRKSDGKMFDKNIVMTIPQEVIKRELSGYFGPKENVEDVLFSPNIEMPKTEPFFTEDGLMFIYQQYEIAPYAYGHPQFILPYDEVEKYLTPSARNLIE